MEILNLNHRFWGQGQALSKGILFIYIQLTERDSRQNLTLYNFHL